MAHPMIALGYVPFTIFLRKSEKAAVKRAAKDEGVPMAKFAVKALAKAAHFEAHERVR